MNYSINDIYYGMSNVVQTTSETIPEGEEREKYSDATVTTDSGNTSIVGKTGIFMTVGVGVVILLMLNMMD